MHLPNHAYRLRAPSPQSRSFPLPSPSSVRPLPQQSERTMAPSELALRRDDAGRIGPAAPTASVLPKPAARPAARAAGSVPSGSAALAEERIEAPVTTGLRAWNGSAWRQRTHAEVRRYFTARCGFYFDRPEFRDAPEGDATVRESVQRAADALALDLRNYCAKTVDPSVLQGGLSLLDVLLQLSCDDVDEKPIRG